MHQIKASVGENDLATGGAQSLSLLHKLGEIQDQSHKQAS
jgi:hypothetical protein